MPIFQNIKLFVQTVLLKFEDENILPLAFQKQGVLVLFSLSQHAVRANYGAMRAVCVPARIFAQLKPMRLCAAEFDGGELRARVKGIVADARKACGQRNRAKVVAICKCVGAYSHGAVRYVNLDEVVAAAESLVTDDSYSGRDFGISNAELIFKSAVTDGCNAVFAYILRNGELVFFVSANARYLASAACGIALVFEQRFFCAR